MKKSLFAFAAALGLAACMTAPQTPEDVRSHSMARSETITVARSPSAVMSTIANRGRSCLNFDSQTQMTRMGQMNANFFDHYRTRTEGRTLVVEHRSPNMVTSEGFYDEWYPRVVADVVPATGGARVTTYAPIGDGVFVDAIQAWAQGDTTPCPRVDLF